MQKLLPANEDFNSKRRAETGPNSRHSSSVNRIVHFASALTSFHSGVEAEVEGVVMWKGSHGCVSFSSVKGEGRESEQEGEGR
jgi:hypothetical protein